MMTTVIEIAWNDTLVAIPAFLTMVTIPLTFSIANGLAFGFTAYTLLHVLRGRSRDVNWMVYVLTALFLVRGLEPHGRDHARFKRFFPGLGTYTPRIARLKPGKSPLRPWCDQIISNRRLVLEEFGIYHYAHGVETHVLRTAITLSVAIKAGKRLDPARLQHAAQNVLHHLRSIISPSTTTAPRGAGL